MTDISFPSPADEWPQITAIEQASDQDGHWQLSLVVAADCKWFRGHFPGNPVLPGVAQLHWAQFFARELCGLGSVTQVKNLKFNKMILPNANIGLQLFAQPDKQRIKFVYTAGDDVCSSGVIEGEFL